VKIALDLAHLEKEKPAEQAAANKSR
ncbi:hypothetical protein ACQWG0_26375, partial [Salmonella enterica subsp. enterica serovar Infantis]